MNPVALGERSPGRLVLASFTDVGPDPDVALHDACCETLVSLVEDDEIAMRYPSFGAWLLAAGDRVVRLPIPDYGIAADADLLALVHHLAALLDRGGSIVVHCGGGIGRAGVVATLVLVALDWDLGDAAAHVRASRAGAGPDSPPQIDQLSRVAALLSASARRRTQSESTWSASAT